MHRFGLYARVTKIEGKHDELVTILPLSKWPSIYLRLDVIETMPLR